MDIKANAEMLEGFMDGYDLTAPEPSANRSASYRHGFANGRDDKPHKRPRDTYENLIAQAKAAMNADAAIRNEPYPDREYTVEGKWINPTAETEQQ